MPAFFNVNCSLSLSPQAMYPTIISEVKLYMPSRTIQILRCICYSGRLDQQAELSTEGSAKTPLPEFVSERIKTNPYAQNQIMLSTNIDALRENKAH